MLYQSHDAFETPDENEIIWRYMDFEKFVSMLDNKVLHFTRVDRLIDKFEGSWAIPNIQLRNESLNDLPPKVGDIFKRSIPMGNEASRKFIFVNCWHRNQYESGAMWKLYLSNNNGIAIQSTFKGLKECFKEDNENCVFIGNTHYIDYKKEPIFGNNFFRPYLYKWKWYEHESELRAMILKMPLICNGKQEIYDFKNKPSTGIGQIDYKADIYVNGIDVPINLNILIEKIYVSPVSQRWFYNLIKSIVNKYELEKEVSLSELSQEPEY